MISENQKRFARRAAAACCMNVLARESKSVGGLVGWAKRKRAHHRAARSLMDGGHVANAPLPTLQDRGYARFAATMPQTAISAIASEISTL